MRITTDDFINDKVINIFTDASMWPQRNDTGCYGFLTMSKNNEINYGVYIDTNSTSNKCEIKGIKMGVLEAIRLRNGGFKGMINIFCDSQISICGIRDWIFDWCYNGNYLVNKNGNMVANQSEFIEIMRLIIEYNPNITFYHQKGHVNIHNKKEIYEARDVFRRNLTPSTDIDSGLIKYLSVCNNEIDNRTRWYLKNQANINKEYRDPIKFIPNSNYNKELHTYNMMTGRTHDV